MSEIWKAITGYPNYEVSNLGRIRSIDHHVKHYGGGTAFRHGKVLRQTESKHGYLYVALNGIKTATVHRLVAIEFCDGYAPGLHVNHKNGIRNDARAENLEWVTPSENAKHSFRELGRIVVGKFGANNKRSKAVVSTCIDTGIETTYPSAMDAVRAGFNGGRISECCAGNSRYHKNHYWRFAA